MLPTTELPTNVVTALTQGRKIEAIRLLRETSGIGLKDAKETVEEYARSRPEVGARLEAASRAGVARLLRWALVVAAGLAMWLWARAIR